MKKYIQLSALAMAVLAATQSYGQTKPASEGVIVTQPGFAAPGLADHAKERPASMAQELPQPKKPIVKPAATQRVEPNKVGDPKVFKPSTKNIIVTEAVHEPEMDELSLMDVTTGGTAQKAAKQEPAPALALGSSLALKPGETATIPIAVGVLNRIVTPFAAVAVDTVSDVQIKTAGSVLLVATADLSPVSVIAREKDAPENAVILTLLPQKGLQARDVKLNVAFPKSLSAGGKRTGGADDELERGSAHPLAVRLKNVMRELAQEKIPSGHSLEQGDGSQANCLLPGVSSSLAQVLAGSNYQIKVYALRNVSGGPIEVDERGCSERHHLASAVWPLQSLAPDEQTELYVIEAPERDAPQAPQRPSALR